MVQEVLQLDTGNAIAHSCAFDKTNNLVVVGSQDGSIKMIDIEKGEVANELKGHEDSVNAVVFN